MHVEISIKHKDANRDAIGTALAARYDNPNLDVLERSVYFAENPDLAGQVFFAVESDTYRMFALQAVRTHLRVIVEPLGPGFKDAVQEVCDTVHTALKPIHPSKPQVKIKDRGTDLLTATTGYKSLLTEVQVYVVLLVSVLTFVGIMLLWKFTSDSIAPVVIGAIPVFGSLISVIVYAIISSARKRLVWKT